VIFQECYETIPGFPGIPGSGIRTCPAVPATTPADRGGRIADSVPSITNAGLGRAHTREDTRCKVGVPDVCGRWRITTMHSRVLTL
jgi:hypothetical protein